MQGRYSGHSCSRRGLVGGGGATQDEESTQATLSRSVDRGRSGSSLGTHATSIGGRGQERRRAWRKKERRGECLGAHLRPSPSKDGGQILVR